MVYIRKIIESNQYLLKEQNVSVYWYNYLRNKENFLNLESKSLKQGDLFAIKGYTSAKSINESELVKFINKPAIRGIDFSSNIFKFLGIYLVKEELLSSRLEQKFKQSNIKNKFVIATIEEQYKSELLKELNNKEDKDIYNAIISFLFSEDAEYPTNELIELIQKQSIDIVDLFLLEEIEKKLLSYSKITYQDKSAYELVCNILNNFSNAILRITKNRRKGHLEFSINDEYDVQDILYTILKAIFPKLKPEEPTPSVGISYNKIDFILEDEGILIETKMLKETDKDERKITDELKVDIQSYYKKEKIKNLICFVYDPFKKIKDEYNLYDLNNEQTINGNKFLVKIIINY